MAMTEKKRITDRDWKKKNKKALTCIVYRADADAFAEYAAARGKSINELLKEYIAACLGRPLEKRTGPQKKAAAGPPADDSIIENMPE